MSRVCYAKDEQSMNISIGRKGMVVVVHVSRVNNYFELRTLTGLLFILKIICEYGESRWNENLRETRLTQRKPCPSSTF
jgi:hypothetical protein